MLVVSGAFCRAFAETAVVLVNEEALVLGRCSSFDTKNAIDGKLTIATDRITFTSRKASFDESEKITFGAANL